MQGRIHEYPRGSASRYAWSALRRFENVDFTSDLIKKRFNLSNKHDQNAIKQANHIRYCLIQAKEYYNSAQSSSAATSPLQMYYCIISLALSQILWLKDGRHALEVMRAEHAHHGLEYYPEIKKGVRLQDIVIRPSKGNRGTFIEWHKCMKEYSIAGLASIRHDKEGYTSSGPDVILAGGNENSQPIDRSGYSIDALMKNLPGLVSELSSFGIASDLVPGRAERSHSVAEFVEHNTILRITVQRSSAESREAFERSVRCPPSSVPCVEARTIGGALEIVLSTNSAYQSPVHFPPGITISQNEVYFHPLIPNLNEFGIYYCALYAIGMICRYFPDVWMRELERRTDFFLLSETLVQSALERVPLATAACLTETLYIEGTDR